MNIIDISDACHQIIDMWSSKTQTNTAGKKQSIFDYHVVKGQLQERTGLFASIIKKDRMEVYDEAAYRKRLEKKINDFNKKQNEPTFLEKASNCLKRIENALKSLSWNCFTAKEDEQQIPLLQPELELAEFSNVRPENHIETTVSEDLYDRWYVANEKLSMHAEKFSEQMGQDFGSLMDAFLMENASECEEIFDANSISIEDRQSIAADFKAEAEIRKQIDAQLFKKSSVAATQGLDDVLSQISKASEEYEATCVHVKKAFDAMTEKLGMRVDSAKLRKEFLSVYLDDASAAIKLLNNHQPKIDRSLSRGVIIALKKSDTLALTIKELHAQRKQLAGKKNKTLNFDLSKNQVREFRA